MYNIAPIFIKHEILRNYENFPLNCYEVQQKTDYRHVNTKSLLPYQIKSNTPQY